MYADVVHSNTFERENKEKMEVIGREYQGRFFIVNSPQGYVIPKEKPGSDKGTSPSWYYPHYGIEPSLTEGNEFVFFNGEIILLTHACLYNGEYWGVMMPSHNYLQPGWVLMDEVLLTFVREDFERIHQNEFYEYTGNYDAVESASRLVEWQWPGSDREKIIVESERSIQARANILIAYKDEEGREWGKTRYYSWICLSDPENSDIPAFYPAPEGIRWSPGHNNEWFSDLAAIETTSDPPANTAIAFKIVKIAASWCTSAIVLVLVLRKRAKTKSTDCQRDK